VHRCEWFKLCQHAEDAVTDVKLYITLLLLSPSHMSRCKWTDTYLTGTQHFYTTLYFWRLYDSTMCTGTVTLLHHRIRISVEYNVTLHRCKVKSWIILFQIKREKMRWSIFHSLDYPKQKACVCVCVCVRACLLTQFCGGFLLFVHTHKWWNFQKPQEHL